MPSQPELSCGPDTIERKNHPEKIFKTSAVPLQSAVAALSDGHMTYSANFLPGYSACLPPESSELYGRRLQAIECDSDHLPGFLYGQLGDYLNLITKTGLILPLVVEDHVVYLMPVNQHAVEFLRKEPNRKLLMDLNSSSAVHDFQERVFYSHPSARGLLHDGALKAILIKPYEDRLIRECERQEERSDFKVLYTAFWNL